MDNQKKLPVSVLKGTNPKLRSVTNAYRAYFIQKFMQLIHTSYWDRASHNSDDLGQSWKELKSVTIYVKQLLLWSEQFNEPDIDNLTNGESHLEYAAGYITEESLSNNRQPQLSGNFKSKFELTPTQLLAYHSKVKSKKNKGGISHSKALQDVTPEFSEQYSEVPINVRSGRLSKALSPPQISNNRIYYSGERVFSYTDLGLNIDLNVVPYAEELGTEHGRPIITQLMISQYTKVAKKFARRIAVERYNAILNKNYSSGKTLESSEQSQISNEKFLN